MRANTGDTGIKILENISFGKTNDPPTASFERSIFLRIPELLALRRMGFAVVALDGEVAVFAENSQVKAENPPARRFATSFRKGGIKREPILRSYRDIPTL